MSIKVSLTNKSQQTDFSGKVGQDSSIRFNRLIYQTLSSLVQNKHIVENYDKLPQEIQELFREFDLLILDPNSTQVKQETLDIDRYLGSLGITETYFYSKDIKDIPPWIEVISQTLYRNIVTQQSGVIYNVITEIDGINYNVIHNTQI
jgi:hypothetical protein